jgi:hypothetical protein
MQRSYFQIRSRSEVPDGYEFFGILSNPGVCEMRQRGKVRCWKVAKEGLAEKEVFKLQ